MKGCLIVKSDSLFVGFCEMKLFLKGVFTVHSQSIALATACASFLSVPGLSALCLIC